MSGKKIAIVDLGTNTFHVLVAAIKGNDFEFLHREKLAVKIGEDGIMEGRISEQAFQRAVAASVHIKSILDRFNVTETKAIATSAIRGASNGQRLLKEIGDFAGIKASTIDGNIEAELIYQGVRLAIGLGNSPSLIMDIGGGSVEFILANQFQIFWKRSFDIGAQRLFDKFHRHDPVSKVELESLDDYLDQELTPLYNAIKKYNPDTLIGSSGTFETLSDIYCLRQNIRLETNDTEKPIDILFFHKIFKDIIKRNRVERLQIPGMSEMRADMISMAVALINRIISIHHFTQLRVSGYALKEGLLIKLINEKEIQELSA